MLGLSGATIAVEGDRVIKRGGTTDLVKQAELCRTLGPDVAPAIYWSKVDAYCMERMNPIETREYMAMLRGVKALLRNNVWRWHVSGHRSCWRDEVSEWLKENAPEIPTHLIPSLYPPFTERPCLIHGDPTLANLMVSDEGWYVLIDPVPPRKAVPSLREQDLAAMLQSSAGWEHVLEPEDWPMPYFDDLSEVVLEGETRLTVNRAYFWAAYKCARIIFHDQRQDTTAWARRWLPRFLTRTMPC